jgi:uncharacterized protein YggE
VRRSGAIAAAALIVATGALALAGVAAGRGPAAAAAPSCTGPAPRLTVTGSGTARGAPDTLTVTASVAASGPSAQSALGQDNAATAAVLAAFRSGGVAAADLQTTGLTLGPQYAYPDGRSVLTGYAATDTVVATLRRLTGAGAVIDAASSAGGDATSIQSIAFGAADPTSLEDRARADAVHQAVSHARAMAAAAGERLGPVCSIVDDVAAPASAPFDVAPATAGPAGVPLAAGSQSAQARVSLVYALA